LPVDMPLRTRPCPVLKGVVRRVFVELRREEPELLCGVLLEFDGGEPRRAVVENAGASIFSPEILCSGDSEGVWLGISCR
jgi:hypothetical protein